jgi:hypothetical protein
MAIISSQALIMKVVTQPKLLKRLLTEIDPQF